MLTARSSIIKTLENGARLTIPELLDTKYLKSLGTTKAYMHKLMPDMVRKGQVEKVPNVMPFHYMLPVFEDKLEEKLVSPTLYESGKPDLSFQLSNQGKIIKDNLEKIGKTSITTYQDVELLKLVNSIIDAEGIEFTIQFLVNTVQALQVKQLE